MSVSELHDRKLTFDRMHFRYHEDPEAEGGGLFEEKSVNLDCPYCKTRSQSLVDYKTNILGYLLALILLLGLGWLSFCILPLVLSLTKSAIHRCPKCLNVVKNNSFLGFNSMEDKVISFTLGKFGIALSWKYLLYIVLTMTCSIILYLIMIKGMNSDYHVPISGLTWPQYLKDCGIESYKWDWMKAFRTFDYYSGKGVEWSGYVVMVESMNDDDWL